MLNILAIMPNFIGKSITMANKPLKPGSPAPKSGQYVTIGPRGGQGKEITSTKGNTLPPAEKPGSTYLLVDPTKNKSGK